MKSKYEWIIFVVIFVFLLSCKSSKSIIRNELTNNCIEEKDVQLLPEDYNIKQSEIGRITIKSYLVIDSLCNGLYIVEYTLKDKTGLVIPVIKSSGEIIKYKSNNQETNIANLESFKKKFVDIIKLIDYEDIKKVFLTGSLRTANI
jgi:hypothetical protein